MKGKINIVGPLILVLALLIYAFSQGFWVGLNLLGDIVNIFGTVFIWLLNFIFSISYATEIPPMFHTIIPHPSSEYFCIRPAHFSLVQNTPAGPVLHVKYVFS